MRYLIDALFPELKRQPFDFNITSRQALIAAFATDGASLVQSGAKASVFTMPLAGRQGVEMSGMFFWHDYPIKKDKLLLEDGWSSHFDRVNAKYDMLWARFTELVRSDTPKTFVLSNCQKDLPEFSAGAQDFKQKFGLGRDAYEEIRQALDAFGARSYRLKFLSRTADEIEETGAVVGPAFEHRLVGPFRLRPEPETAAGLFPELRIIRA